VDLETLDVKENNYNSKNLSKQEMDDQKRLKKKRANEELLKGISTDLSKKRRLDE
jgi:hypothetical protein